ncbi:MAG: Zn-dependent hydrolase, RNA-metabolising [uncultured Sulfurovum sp.]|uniref:Ribonuclease J n=1 Tax=uncultured Sulfurovum sp. TaxID=269237 RepID=A0A6S6SJF2_9BACT|nr:MAG: Zn-dependent hydrolase, RNA-metabolising [uncultured Sulfurovum sp.]
MENNNENNENKTPQNTSEEKKPRRDRPERPKRAGNPHRRQQNNNQAVDGNKPQPEHKVNGNVEKPNKEVNGNKQIVKPNPNQKTSQPKKPQHNKPNPNAKKPQHNNPNAKKPNNNKNSGGGGRRPKKFVPGPMSEEMKTSIAENVAMNDARMNPWKQINMDNNNKVRFTPLGGLGEIGGNMAVMEDDECAFVIDVGMSFPDETMHGVDILVPDFSYLHAIKDKIVAVIITHAHEDHIGAVPYLYKELQFPIWGTPLALAMIENKFQEHGLMENVKLFNYVTKRTQYDIGTFKLEWMHNTHSIIDACSLAIESKVGTFIHTADFKVDHTPIDNQTMDLQRFAHYGSKGVLCLFSDSTNSHNPGYTKSEAVVGKTFDTLFSLAKGRVIMSTFSSNTHRVYQAMERGIAAGRKICVIGRSMERNIETTRRLGYVDLPDKHFIEAHEVQKYAEEQVLIVTTGSQGEAMAALSRMAANEHRHVKLKPSDTIIISAHAIPGNEGSVSSLMNKLVKAGVTVRYKDFENIHVSGHASKGEQQLILRLIQPKFFLPVHGEYNHIYKHSRTAIDCGVDPRNILLMSDGDQIEIATKYLKKVKTVKTGKSYIDNQNNKEIKADVVEDRQKLASDGIVNIAMQVNKETKKLIGKAVISSSGLVPEKEGKRFAHEIENIIDTFLINAEEKQTASPKVIQENIASIVRKFVVRTKKRYPIITPVIFMA